MHSLRLNVDGYTGPWHGTTKSTQRLPKDMHSNWIMCKPNMERERESKYCFVRDLYQVANRNLVNVKIWKSIEMRCERTNQRPIGYNTGIFINFLCILLLLSLQNQVHTRHHVRELVFVSDGVGFETGVTNTTSNCSFTPKPFFFGWSSIRYQI